MCSFKGWPGPWGRVLSPRKQCGTVKVPGRLLQTSLTLHPSGEMGHLACSLCSPRTSAPGKCHLCKRREVMVHKAYTASESTALPQPLMDQNQKVRYISVTFQQKHDVQEQLLSDFDHWLGSYNLSEETQSQGGSVNEIQGEGVSSPLFQVKPKGRAGPRMAKERTRNHVLKGMLQELNVYWRQNTVHR